MNQKIVTCKLLLLIFLIIFCREASLVAQTPEIPVLVNKVSTAKALFIIDDSGSMAAVVEHPSFSSTSAVATNTSNTIPAIIFRVDSAAAAPTVNQTLRPILIEYNYLYNNVLTSTRGQVTGNLYNTGTLATPTTINSIKHFGCTSNTSYCCPTVGTCNTSNYYGVNNAVLFSNGAIKGPAVFALANLAQSSGVNVTDTTGNEFLYVNAHSNLYYTIYNDWTSYWPKFDASGNQISYQTRTFSSPGGTVKFNNKQVFLAAGLYRIEYLRWIFYAATPAEIAALPGATRIQIVKDVMEDLINNNPNVSFGLATLNGSNFSAGVNSGYLIDEWYTPEGNSISGNYPKIRAPIGTSAATLISTLDTIGPDGGTPLANTYIETLRYFNGQTDNDPNCNNCQYISPVTSQCDGHFVVLLTDGLPTSETANSFNGSFIGDCDGDSADGAATNQNCSSSVCQRFLDDAACTAKNFDFKSSIPGVQNVTSYAVGLGLDYSLLNDFAYDGGTGTSLSATTSSEVSLALQNIINIIINTPVSGAGVALAESFGQTGKVYRPRFRADVWRGNIDVFQYASGGLQFTFDMGDMLESRNLGLSPRTIIVGYDPDHDGNTNQTRAFITANAATLRPELFEDFYSGATSTSLLASPLTSYTLDSSSIALINYVHGIDQAGMRTRDQDVDGLVEKLGDIVYSKPVEVGPKNGTYSKFSGYSEFVAGLQTQPSILLVGANDGQLHAFNSTTGTEIWSYIPANVVKHLEKLSRPQYNISYRRSYVDADIVVEDAWVNGAWKTLAMFGLRTGGTSYTVLDITNRTSPTLLFEVNANTNGGQSWSSPIVIPVNGPTSSADPSLFSWYMLVGTGEAKATAGTNIIAYPINSSAPTGIVVSLNAADPAGTRTSGLTALQTDQDLNVDRIYVGTESGNMYRIHTTGVPGTWVKQQIYSGTSTQPIVASPLGVLVENPLYNPAASTGIQTMETAVGVYFGTGRYDTSVDITGAGATTQSIIGLFDPVDVSGDAYSYVLTGMSKATLKNQSIGQFGVTRGTGGVYKISTAQSGFYIDLATSITVTGSNFINPVGMITDTPLNLMGAILFSTFMPNQGMCNLGGYGFLQAVNFRTGGGVLVDYNSNQDNPFYNGGIPNMDGDSDYDNADLTAAYNSGLIQPALDAKVQSIDLTLTNPYIYDGLLLQNDIRLHATNGGIEPTVASLGNTGAPSGPAVLFGAGKIVIQPAYPVPPTNGAGVTASSTVPPPTTIPINIYNQAPSILSFHESTGN